MNTTILKGITIGNKVVIGATSLINKDVPSNYVVAENPQRIVMDIDDYCKNRQKHSLMKYSIYAIVAVGIPVLFSYGVAQRTYFPSF